MRVLNTKEKSDKLGKEAQLNNNSPTLIFLNRTDTIKYVKNNHV